MLGSRNPKNHFKSAPLLVIAFGVVVYMLVATGKDQREGKQSKNYPKVFKERETVSIGYTSYAVWRSWWSDRLSATELPEQRPDDRYLYVELTVRNDDNNDRTIQPFKLLDEGVQEHESIGKGLVVDGVDGIVTSLDPKVEKQGVIVFDVPIGHKYKLKISGGFWSPEVALVELSPKKTQ